jgi:dUTP pyrophosphatase
MLTNSVGVIDSTYIGEVEARFKPSNYSPLHHKMMARTDNTYKKGDAVCQLIIMPYPQVNAQWVDELSETERGDGGFGSTGN